LLPPCYLYNSGSLSAAAKKKKKRKKKKKAAVDLPAVDLPTPIERGHAIRPHDKIKMGRLDDWLLKGAHLSRQKARDTTLLFDAAEVGHMKAATLLLEKPGVRILQEIEIEGVKYTALHFAATRGHCNMVKLLLSRPEAQVNRGEVCTPLLLAAEKGRVGVVEILLGHSAIDIHKAGWNGDTPIVKASLNGHVQVTKMLLDAGADKESEDQDGWTVLCNACEKGYTDIVRILLDIGVDTEKTMRDEDGVFALYVAARGGFMNITNLLLAAGADVNKVTTFARSTPLYTASQCGQTNIVEILLRAGALTDKAAKTGAIPLHVACQVEMTTILLPT
jgi:ankyrin repeat protein